MLLQNFLQKHQKLNFKLGKFIKLIELAKKKRSEIEFKKNFKC